MTRTILEVADSDPDRIALDGDGERFTYRQLVEASTRVRAGAEQLLAVSPTEREPDETEGVPIIAVSLSRAIDAARFLCATNGFRAIIAVLDPLWPLSHRLETIARVNAALVISDDADFLAQLDTSSTWAGTTTSLVDFDAMAASVPSVGGPEVRPRDEPFLLLFTSGTTDLPKGFVRTRESWDYNVAVSKTALGAREGSATIAPGPISYSLTLYALVEVIATGGSLYLQSQFDAIGAARSIDADKIDRFVGVPSMLLALVSAAEHSDLSLASLRCVITGGANQSETIRSTFERAVPEARLRSYYGASEIGFIGYSDSGDGTRLTPFDGVEVSVREGGVPVPDGEIGTLHIRVDSAVERYLASTSTERVTGDDGWASVNDQASFTHGIIDLAGRAGDIAVSGGHKVSLPQVERALSSLPGCESCCAVALTDAVLGSVIAVAVEGSHVPPKNEIQSGLRSLLAPQFMPHRYFRVDELPRTAGGKIRRVAVAELLARGEAERL